jgi:hypothetical protein
MISIAYGVNAADSDTDIEAIKLPHLVKPLVAKAIEGDVSVFMEQLESVGASAAFRPVFMLLMDDSMLLSDAEIKELRQHVWSTRSPELEAIVQSPSYYANPAWRTEDGERDVLGVYEVQASLPREQRLAILTALTDPTTNTRPRHFAPLLVHDQLTSSMMDLFADLDRANRDTIVRHLDPTYMERMNDMYRPEKRMIAQALLTAYNEFDSVPDLDRHLGTLLECQTDAWLDGITDERIGRTLRALPGDSQHSSLQIMAEHVELSSNADLGRLVANNANVRTAMSIRGYGTGPALFTLLPFVERKTRPTGTSRVWVGQLVSRSIEAASAALAAPYVEHHAEPTPPSDEALLAIMHLAGEVPHIIDELGTQLAFLKGYMDSQAAIRRYVDRVGPDAIIAHLDRYF